MPSVPERITAFNKNRDPEKVQIKYNVMRQDAFRFFRGTCHLYYEDLYQHNSLTESPAVWLCGDLHLENFGSFKGIDRLVYFDLNDFDEAILGPASWEISRLLCSVSVAARTARYSKVRIEHLNNALLHGYCSRLQKGKAMTVETATASGPVKTLLEKVENRKEKRLLKDRAVKSIKYTRLRTNDKKAFTISPAAKRKEIAKAVNQWLIQHKGARRWKVLDTVFRIAGTGSIGIRRYAVLVENNNTGKKLLLDVKQALPSTLQQYISIPQPQWENDASRIISIQYRMQHVCPAFLETLQIGSDWFVIKEVQPTADRIDFISFKKEPEEQEYLLETLGQLVASAQLRSSGRQGSVIADNLLDFGKQNNWQQPVCEYANNYALQVEKDYREFCKAFDKGYFRKQTTK